MFEGRTQKPVIQSDRCHSCDVCIRGCPAEFIPEYREEKKSLRGALYRDGLLVKPLMGKVPLPPCQEACPIHQDVRGYVALITEGKFKEALDLIRKVNPLPAVCGFVCHHPCEEACLREGVDHPIPIRLLKRFVAEYERKRIGKKVLKKRREKVLVIGSGPAGLTAANDLTLLGFEVTVFEALPVLGGMLAVGIPEFRLPREILRREIDGIRGLGVDMIPNRPFQLDDHGKRFQKMGYHAVFLAIGAHRSLRLNIPGEKLKGVFPGVEFLRDLNLGKKTGLGKEVAVIGGGNVAVDVARSSLLLGAKKVSIFYRRSKKEMSAIPEEVEAAIHEGVKIYFLASPLQLIGRGGRVVGMECVRNRLGEPDESGRRRPVAMEGSNFRVWADTIISATGQRVDPRPLKGFQTNRDGTIWVDPDTNETSMKGFFSGGDAVTGPGWVIDAIAAGKKGADSIYRYLT
jgi:NADPH-dependent glutamate synthase beta subunit-like oxidoreductase